MTMPALSVPNLLHRPGAAASVLLHGALLAALALIHVAPVMQPTIRSVDVDLIAMPPPERVAVPAPAEPVPAQPVEPAASGGAGEPSDGPFRATRFYAGSLLAEPASARLRQQLGTVTTGERIVQLCDIEAMQQVHEVRPDYDPDMVVPYARGETRMEDGVLVATGGAFRSNREWYELSFRCRPGSDLSQIEAFEFTLGEMIPHERWDGYFLTAEESSE